MDLRIDQKGKYYTPRIAKNALVAYVRTNDNVIVGQLYARPERRLKDELNDDQSRFLPITDAAVYSPTGETLLFRSAFLLVAYEHIALITPLEAVEADQPIPWLQYDEQTQDDA